MIIFKIENLKELLKAFSETECDYYSENCIVTLENKHSSGCSLKVVGEKPAEIILDWEKKFRKAGYKEERKLTGNAAIAISSFLSDLFTDYSFIEEARLGTGIDYWLSYKEDHVLYDPNNFFQARIEISGIYEEKGTNTLENRVKIKKRQTTGSKHTGLPAYISIVVFYPLKAFFAEV